jgi:hypothetical protein
MQKVENKVTAEELKTIQEQQGKMNETINRIGVLETQKHHLLHEIALVNEEVEKTKKQLEDKYGSINVNVEDGTYSEIKEEAEAEEVEHV